MDQFIRRNPKPEASKRPAPAQKDDDVEVLAGYFVKKKLYNLMYDHQKEGLKWLFSLHQQGKGCILADGMIVICFDLFPSVFEFERCQLTVLSTIRHGSWQNHPNHRSTLIFIQVNLGD